MNKYTLAEGTHTTREDGMCGMEWVAYLAGEPHTDKPVCVSPLLRTFVITLNDSWDRAQRQKLRPYLARCIGTAGDGLDTERSWMAADWLCREYTPSFLDLVPQLRPHAGRLRGLPPVLSDDAWNAAARADLSAAGAAAENAKNATWTVATSGAAANAAGNAAKSGAGNAAKSAARGNAAREAAWHAWHATWAAAWIAAEDATRDVLQPTVERLQTSALDLLDRMLPTELIQLPVAADAELVCAVPTMEG